MDYRWSYSNSTVYMGLVSSAKAVGVATKVSASQSATSIRLGKTVTISGTVSPSHAGKTVYLQRLVNGVWTNKYSRTLTSKSTFSFTIAPSPRGTYYYRVYKPADTDHLAGHSSTRTVKVS